MAKEFLEIWGIPTAMSLIQTRRNTNFPIIATGGIRSGEEVVKALVLGANIGTAAFPMLRSAAADYETVEKHLEQIVKEIGDIMFLIGAKTVPDLQKIKPIITGRLKELTS